MLPRNVEPVPAAEPCRSQCRKDERHARRCPVPISRRRPPLPLRTSSGAAPRVEVALAEGRRLRDPQTAAPEHDGHSAHPVAVAVVAGPCCGADVRRDSQAWSRASDADRRHRALASRSWRHHLQIALSLRPGEAEAGGTSARHPGVVLGDSLVRRIEHACFFSPMRACAAVEGGSSQRSRQAGA
jgi:hypothetical protein